MLKDRDHSGVHVTRPAEWIRRRVEVDRCAKGMQGEMRLTPYRPKGKDAVPGLDCALESPSVQFVKDSFKYVDETPMTLKGSESLAVCPTDRQRERDRARSEYLALPASQVHWSTLGPAPGQGHAPDSSKALHHTQ